MSSIFLAREFGVQVWAADVWVPASENKRRVDEAQVDDSVFPLYAEARALPFPHAFFDAMVSIDSYHYFGTDVRYLPYLSRFVKPEGTIGVVVPGNSTDPDDLDHAVAAEGRERLGADYFTFRSPEWWGRHWSRTKEVTVERAQMLDGGHDLWLRHEESSAAASGQPSRDAGLLESAPGSTLGFVVVVGRRTAEAALRLGPGPWESRLA